MFVQTKIICLHLENCEFKVIGFIATKIKHYIGYFVRGLTLGLQCDSIVLIKSWVV